MKRLLAAILLTLLVSGCETTTSQQAEKPPKQADRVKVVMYDSAPRTKSEHFEVLDRVPQKPHKVIALLICEGAAKEEPEMTEAIIYRARMLGAGAIVMLAPGGQGVNGFGSVRCVFRGNAVIYKMAE